MRGGEKVVEQLCGMYPDADIFTHAVDSGSISDTLNSMKISTTFIQRLPLAKKWYQSYLPLMPLALEQLDLRGYDLIISSESGPAKGVITDPNSLHICYCHSPMRYVWDMYHDYLSGAGVLKKILMRPLIHYLRMWDVTTAARVDLFMANSTFVSSRIRKFYRRDAIVVPPPIKVSDYQIAPKTSDYYLMVGQLVDYKKTDLAVKAFNRMGKKLVIIGAGSQLAYLKEIARENIELLGYQDSEVIKQKYSECLALIFPGLEDFGMVPIEAMASGRPVIAYGRGGALDYVEDNYNGILFYDQTEEAIEDAVTRFEKEGVFFSPEEIKQSADSFSESEFERKFRKVVEENVQG
jgi:glycosyltransferase involved in cell wall biosynthesis